MQRRIKTWMLVVAVMMQLSGGDAGSEPAILIEGQGTVLRDNTVDTGGTAIEVGDSTTGAKLSGNTILNALLGIDRGGQGGNLIAGNSFENVTTEWSQGGGDDGVLQPNGTFWKRICLENEPRDATTCLYPASFVVDGTTYTFDAAGNLTAPGTVTAGAGFVGPTFETAPGVPLPSIGRIALNSGAVVIDETAKQITLKGIPPTRFFTQTGDPNTIWGETELDFKAAFALYVDKSCFPDEPDQCGPINRPCCTINQALDRIQSTNGGAGDNGFATCSVDQVTGCGRCSGDTELGCNQNSDCYDQCIGDVPFSVERWRCPWSRV